MRVQDGNRVALSQLRGKTVVLYFYPKADTPGCTTQACGVRDHAPDYDAAGAVVLGVSRDPVSRLRAFADNGGAVLVSSHLLAEVAQSVEHVVIIDQGHAVADAPLEELASAGQTLEDAYLSLTSTAAL